MAKYILIITMIFISFNINAGNILRQENGPVSVDTLSNTTGGAYDGFQVISMHPNSHKIIVLYANGRYAIEYCNQVDGDGDVNCDTWNPDLIFAEWDSIQGAGNVTVGTALTNAEMKQYQAHWFFGAYINNDLNSLYNELVANVLLTDAERQDRYYGACRAYEFDDSTCLNFINIRFVIGRRPRVGEMTLVKVPGRFKKMIDQMGSIIVAN